MNDDDEQKRAEQNFIACSGKSEAKVTNNRRLHSTYCTIEVNYWHWQTRSIARPLCNSRAICIWNVQICKIYDFFVFAAGYIDVDCGIRRDAVPSVDGFLADPPCCSMDCTGDDCPPTQDRCARVVLRTTNAIDKAHCRFDVNTVRPTSLLTMCEITE